MTPVVTCLTVTRATPERLPRLRRSLAALANQTWPARQSVIVIDATPGSDVAAVRALAEPLGATILVPPPGASLGALRNASVAAGTGAFLCQWDDDDLHHPERIARQMAALTASGTAAVALADVLHHFEADATLAWTNWAATPAGAHPGTLLCRRDAAIRYPEHGPESRLGEDLAVALALRTRGALATLAGEPHLYVYVAHGANVSPDSHHRMLARTLGLSQGLLRRREAAIRAGIAGIDLGARPIGIRGPNGTAFTLDPA